MKTRYLLVGGILGIALLLPGIVMATSDACSSQSKCRVPAPTLISIEENSSFYANEVTILGLSWNETLVDVYIDGIYNGRAYLNTDGSGVGNFLYRPFLPLTAGEHYAYAVARNLSEKERSIESEYVYFNVINRPIVATNIIEETFDISEILPEAIVTDQIEEDQQVLEEYFEENFADLEEEDAIPAIIVEEIDTAVNVSNEEESGEVSVSNEEESGEVSVIDGGLDQYTGGAIEGGVSEEKPQEISDLQETADIDAIISEFFAEDEDLIAQRIVERERQNRNIGLAMLAVIIVIIVAWAIVGRRERSYNEIDELFGDKLDSNSHNSDDPLINMDNLSNDSLFTPPDVSESVPPIEDEPIIPDSIDRNDDDSVFRM
jgi:hypothetical protein